MRTNQVLPPGQPLVDRQGNITRAWWDWFYNLLSDLSDTNGQAIGNTDPSVLGKLSELDRSLRDVQMLAFLTRSSSSEATAVSSTPTYTLPLVNGDTPGPSLIADDVGQCIAVPI